MPELLNTLADFHFLRPLWLLALLLIPLIYFWMKRHSAHSSSWARAIDQHLLRHLLENSVKGSQRSPIYLMIIGVVLTAVALAGPVWKKIPQPVHKTEDALAIVLDLSLSMQVQDIKPNRLTKARHKLIDLLNARTEGLTALVVYAGDAHIVSPHTDDTDTIKSMVPALSPLIMPAMGSKPDVAIQLAQQLMTDAGINRGRILLITDGIEKQDIEEIANLINDGKHKLALLAVGTEEGGPIPIPDKGFLKQRGQIVIANNDLSTLRDLANETGARLVSLRLDDSDFEYLLDDPILNLNQPTRQVEREFDQWHEQGPWLLLVLAPLAALAFRRGWLASLLVLVLWQPPPSYALEWQDLWRTKNQQGAKAFEQGDHQRAAELFESMQWKASAEYKAGDYEAAVNSFGQRSTPDAYYNQGNALAKAGKLEEAIAAYDKTLEQEPDHEDATFNRQLIEQLLKQQQQNPQQGDSSDQEQNEQQRDQNQQQQEQQQSQGNQGESEQNQDSRQQNDQQQQNAENSNSNDSEQSNQAQDKGESQQSDSQSEQNKEKEQQESSQQKQQKAQGSPEETDKADQQAALEQAQEMDEQQQAREMLLKRIPDDPSGLLKRKFNYQYRQRQLDNQFLPQQDKEPIW